MLSGMSLFTKVIAPIVTLLPILRLLPIIEVPTPRSTLSPIVILGLEFSFFTPPPMPIVQLCLILKFRPIITHPFITTDVSELYEGLVQL